MLESTVFEECTLRDVFVLLGEAHGKPEIDLRVGVELGGAELDDIAEAFFLAVFAGDTVVVVGDAGALCQYRLVWM